jgi:hypothetical protein
MSAVGLGRMKTIFDRLWRNINLIMLHRTHSVLGLALRLLPWRRMPPTTSRPRRRTARPVTARTARRLANSQFQRVPEADLLDASGLHAPQPRCHLFDHPPVLCQLPPAADMASNVLEEYQPPLHHQTIKPPRPDRLRRGSMKAACAWTRLRRHAAPTTSADGAIVWWWFGS